MPIVSLRPDHGADQGESGPPQRQGSAICQNDQKACEAAVPVATASLRRASKILDDGKASRRVVSYPKACWGDLYGSFFMQIGCLIPVSKSIPAEPLFCPLPGTRLSPKSFPAVGRMLHHSALWLWPPKVLDAMADRVLSGLQPTWRDRLGHRPGWGRRFRDFDFYGTGCSFCSFKQPSPFPASGTLRR